MIYPFSGISKRRQEKGLVKASVSRQRDAVECTHRATYTHTNRVSVLGLRLWLLWVFSWEITVNKIRREEFCLYVNVCLWECVSNSSTFSSPLSSINADQSGTYIHLLHIRTPTCTRFLDIQPIQVLSCSHVHRCINTVISKLWRLLDRISWVQFGFACKLHLTLVKKWQP